MHNRGNLRRHARTFLTTDQIPCGTRRPTRPFRRAGCGLAKRLLKSGTVLLLVLFGAVQAAGKDASAQNSSCQSRPLPARCTETIRRDMHKRFGLPSIEDMFRRQAGRASHPPVVVAIGTLKMREDIAIIFRRNRKGVPTVEVHREPMRGVRGRPRPLMAQLTETAWEEVLNEARSLDVDHFADLVCLGGGVFTVEFADGVGGISSRTNDNCGGDPGIELFKRATEIAVKHLPYCNALKPEHEDDELGKLLACFSLDGERLVSAELFNLLDKHQFWNRNGRDADDITSLFSKDTELVWPALPAMKSPETIAEFLTGGALFPFEFKRVTYLAESRDRIVIRGCLTVESKEDLSAFEALDGSFFSVWERAGAGSFRMVRLEARSTEAVVSHRTESTFARNDLGCGAIRYSP